MKLWITCQCWLLLALMASVSAWAEPLSLGQRLLPGIEPTPNLVLHHEDATDVFVRHSGDDWSRSYPMSRTAEGAPTWTISTGKLGWLPGSYEFKFIVNTKWEGGGNRYAYVNADRLIARPPALYLTWQRDPDTTMTIHWHSDSERDTSAVQYKSQAATDWLQTVGTSIPFPDTGRFIHTVELTGLDPDTIHEFRLPGSETYRFRTLPSTLSRSVRFVEGGDVFESGDVMDRMNRYAGSLQPDFAVIGGDLAYADGLAEHVWRWHRMFDSFYHHLRTPEGLIIPIIVAIGNHEVQKYYLSSHDDYMPGVEWQLKVAPYFYRLFAMPGLPGYQTLDVGDYASFILLDTGHTVPVAGQQTEWLAAQLNERRTVPHLFPVYHVPAYPAHRNPNDPLNSEIRREWVPLFEEAGVQLAFEHHDHAFKVTHPLRGDTVDPDGIVYIGDGAWAVGLRRPHTPEEAWYIRKSAMVHHIIEVKLEADGRTVRVHDIDGNILDEFSQAVRSPVSSAP